MCSTAAAAAMRIGKDDCRPEATALREEIEQQQSCKQQSGPAKRLSQQPLPQPVDLPVASRNRLSAPTFDLAVDDVHGAAARFATQRGQHQCATPPARQFPVRKSSREPHVPDRAKFSLLHQDGGLAVGGRQERGQVHPGHGAETAAGDSLLRKFLLYRQDRLRCVQRSYRDGLATLNQRTEGPGEIRRVGPREHKRRANLDALRQPSHLLGGEGHIREEEDDIRLLSDLGASPTTTR